MLVLALLLGAARPGYAQPARLDAPVGAIRSAVLASDVRGFLRCFEGGRPIFIRVPPLERGAFLGPGQLESFVRRLLAERDTVAFEVADVPEPRADAGQAFVKAVWTYRTSASSTLQVDHVHLVLSHEPERARWLIVELKAASR